MLSLLRENASMVHPFCAVDLCLFPVSPDWPTRRGERSVLHPCQSGITDPRHAGAKWWIQRWWGVPVRHVATGESEGGYGAEGHPRSKGCEANDSSLHHDSQHSKLYGWRGKTFTGIKKRSIAIVENPHGKPDWLSDLAFHRGGRHGHPAHAHE